MSQTPDRFPGIRYEEELALEDRTADGDPTVETHMRYVSGAFRFKDSVGVYDPRAGGGMTEAQHKLLRHLIHFIDDGPTAGIGTATYRERLPAGSPFPTSIIWYDDDTKANKIVEKTLTYGETKAQISQILWEMYDTDGSTVLVTVTDAIAYDGRKPFELSRVRTTS